MDRERWLRIRSLGPKFDKPTISMLCMCWTFDEQNGVLRITPRAGVSIDEIKNRIVPVGVFVERLPEGECAFSKIKR
jgi:hypothetical protein